MEGEVMGCIYRRGKTYWLQFYGRGLPIYESAAPTAYEAATRLLRHRVGAVADDKAVRRPSQRITVEEALVELINDYRVHKRRTLKHAERRVQRHLLPFFHSRGVERLAAVTLTELRAFAAHRQAARA